MGRQTEYHFDELANLILFFVGKLNTVPMSGQIEHRFCGHFYYCFLSKLNTVLMSGQIEFGSDEWAN